MRLGSERLPAVTVVPTPHADIAFEFAAWVSVEFKLYLIKEFERYKEAERQSLDWDIRRNLSKINYRLQTDAIQKYLTPRALTKSQVNAAYASEADVLNVALFGKTAAQWRAEQGGGSSSNIRDQATGAQLVCLANLESFNALWISEGVPQSERIKKLRSLAVDQMGILGADKRTTRILPETKTDADNDE